MYCFKTFNVLIALDSFEKMLIALKKVLIVSVSTVISNFNEIKSHCPVMCGCSQHKHQGGQKVQLINTITNKSVKQYIAPTYMYV